MPLYIAAKRLPDGPGKYIQPGSLVPDAAHWRRLDVSVSRGDLVILGDDVLDAIAEHITKSKQKK